MLSKYYVKKDKLWTPASLEKAATEYLAGKFKSLDECCSFYHMSRFTLHCKVNVLLGKRPEAGHQGRKKALSDENEQYLASVIKAMARAGRGYAVSELPDLVQEFCEVHDIHAFAGHDGKPWDQWIRSFVLRHELSKKKPIALSVGREEATSNPFVVYPFFDMLDEEIKKIKDQGVSDDELPHHIINLDETAFSYDPSPNLVVGAKGEECHFKRIGEGRTNTSVLATISASGHAYPPLVIFKLMHKPQLKILDKCIDGFLMEVSKSGWMTTEIFCDWFEDFCRKETRRPLLILLDGHVSHVGLRLIEHALSQNIALVKLPPHTTDILQPCDQIFGVVKSKWNGHLKTELQSGRSRPISKQEFCECLSRLWEQDMVSNVIVAGFRHVGVFPVDSSKYKISRLNPHLLAGWRRYCDDDRPLLTDEVYEKYTRVKSPRKVDHSKDGRPVVPRIEIPKKPDFPPVPQYDPPTTDDDWVPEWRLVWAAHWSRSSSCLPDSIGISTASTSSSSFAHRTPEEREDEFLRRLTTPQMTRLAGRKRPKSTELMTSPDFLESAKEKQKKKDDKAQKKADPKPPKKAAPKKRARDPSPNESDFDFEVSAHEGASHDSNSDSELSIPLISGLDRSASFPEFFSYLRRVQRPLAKAEFSELNGGFYAVYWDHKFYIGRLDGLFAFEEGRDNDTASMTFLYDCFSGVYSFRNDPRPEQVNIHFIFAGPLDYIDMNRGIKSSSRCISSTEKFTFYSEGAVKVAYALYKKHVDDIGPAPDPSGSFGGPSTSSQ